MDGLDEDRVRTMHRDETGQAERCFATMDIVFANLERAIGVWADTIRDEARLRHGADAAETTLRADPAYAAALDALQALSGAYLKLSAAKTCFATAEAVPQSLRVGTVC